LGRFSLPHFIIGLLIGAAILAMAAKLGLF
jgi:hypothetical protein